MNSIPKIIRKVKKRFYIKTFNGIKIRHTDEIAINTNLSCNLNCAMCHQGEIKCKKDMSYDLFKKI